jgi:hypothetical protein
MLCACQKEGCETLWLGQLEEDHLVKCAEPESNMLNSTKKVVNSF